MLELEKRIGLLRLLLADIEGKQERVLEMEGQYRAQQAKVVEFVVYRDGDVGNALNVMSEIQAKLDEVVQTSNHLDMIARRADSELEVVFIVQRGAEACYQLC